MAVKRADNIAYPYIPWIAGKPDATVNTADAVYVAGGGEGLQHFRNMVSRNSELIAAALRISGLRTARRMRARNPKSVKLVTRMMDQDDAHMRRPPPIRGWRKS